jgi:hypothetical protein
LVSSEGGGSPEGGVHGGAAWPEGNGGEGRCPVVEVGGSRLGKMVGTRAVVGAASAECVSGQRRLGGGRRWQGTLPWQRNGGGETAQGGAAVEEKSTTATTHSG